MENRIKSTQIRAVREACIKKQDFKCMLCGGPILDSDRVHLDHDHKTGAIRAALHGQCNLLLGKVERGLRTGIRDPRGFVLGLASYLDTHSTNQTGLIHPTFLTQAEKAERRKRRAKKNASKPRDRRNKPA